MSRPYLVIAACCLVSGCVAAPLAQVAVSQARQAAANCAAGAPCPPLEDGGGVASVAHNAGDALRRATGSWELY